MFKNIRALSPTLKTVSLLTEHDGSFLTGLTGDENINRVERFGATVERAELLHCRCYTSSASPPPDHNILHYFLSWFD